jgi:L-serine dehydratase
MGPFLAASKFRENFLSQIDLIRVTLFGSLAMTGKGHGTDKAIAKALENIPHEIIWDEKTDNLPHPNTVKFEAFHGGNIYSEWVVQSTGGGALADFNGPISEYVDPEYKYSNISQAIKICQDRHIDFWKLAEEHEGDIWGRLEKIWEVMRRSIERGIRNNRTVISGPLGLKSRAAGYYRHIHELESPQLDLALLSAYSLAPSEENACGEEIVTAPTCGSCGVLPGLLYYFEINKAVSRSEILKALATAGLFGAVIKANASISGAEVGCQGEIGSACSMASAACAQILGGTLKQVEYAAEMGMEHHLGLTCDPVEGYVQIPCIERNMFACLRAFECGSSAVLTDGNHSISFDDVIEVMYKTGLDMNSEYRETAIGGLSHLWKEKLKAKFRIQ